MPNSKLKVDDKKTKEVKKTVKKVVTKIVNNEKVTEKTVAKNENFLTVPSYSLTGKEVGKLDLPKDIFGVKVNKPLLTQALRVYFNNQLAHYSNTKTRGEVEGSTKKVYRQKGTGGARHGGIRAPIYVGGGIALGPKYRKVNLNLPDKMKKAALISALSDKAKRGEVITINNLNKISGKTKDAQALLKNIGKRNVLIITDGKNEMLQRAVQNIPHTSVLSAEQINPWLVVLYKTLIFTEEAIKKLELRLGKEEKVGN